MEDQWKLFRHAGALFVASLHYNEAECCWKKALQVAQQHLSERHARLVLEDLAGLYWVCGRNQEAEIAILNALKVGERELGTSHPEIAMLLKNLAMLYHIQEQYSQSAQCFRRALGILATIYGSKHSQVRSLLPGYANVLEKLGKIEEAKSIRKQAGSSVQQSTWIMSGFWTANSTGARRAPTGITAGVLVSSY